MPAVIAERRPSVVDFLSAAFLLWGGFWLSMAVFEVEWSLNDLGDASRMRFAAYVAVLACSAAAGLALLVRRRIAMWVGLPAALGSIAMAFSLPNPFFFFSHWVMVVVGVVLGVAVVAVGRQIE